ncbi:MAG: family 20 glycosylhydrolase [Actinomycetota bacterium]
MTGLRWRHEPGLPAVVPRPRSLQLTGGRIDLSAGLHVVEAGTGVVDGVLAAVRVRPGPVPLELRLTDQPADVGATAADPDWRVREAYRLSIAPDRVTIVATAPAGLLAAAATLGQVLDGAGPLVPCLDIADAPRFAWRGLSLDVARRFFPVEDLELVVDLLADLRMNVLHLHLTDDQGWRIEVPGWPELTGLSSSGGCGGGPGGFYTAADLARVTETAHRRGVVVVPEIDVPGHVNAALHAVPGLNPDGVVPREHTGTEVGFSRLHSSAPATGPFLRDVLGFVAGLAADRVHIGGDEPPEMPAAEYADLVRTAAAHVVAAGRSVVAWQEAASAGLPPGSVLQWWDERAPVDDVVAAVRGGARLLLSPASAVYLDVTYSADFPLGLEWAGETELRDSHDWDVLGVVPGVGEEHIMGIEACLFSETLRTRDDLTTMLLPRLAAVAEAAWAAAEQRDWNDFARRMPSCGRRWTAQGLAWHRSPGVEWA